MNLILIIIVCLLLFGGGGYYVHGAGYGPYAGPGIGIFGLIVIVLIVIFFTGA